MVHGYSLEKALEWAAGEGGLTAELQVLINRALGTKQHPLNGGSSGRLTSHHTSSHTPAFHPLLAVLQYDVPEYMKEMVNKHVEIKDQLPPFTWAVW